MTTRQQLYDLARHPQVAAFLRVIREGETTQDDERAYRMIVGGGLLESFADHPRKLVRIERLGVSSTAAGAYQFLARTWDGLVAKYGFPDFSPPNQDAGAVGLIIGRRALEDVLAGRLEQAIAKCAKEWASLPGDVYRQGGITMQRAKAVFIAYGGELEGYPPAEAPIGTQEPAPIEERSTDARPEDVARITEPVERTTPMAAPLALILPLVQSLFSIFTPIAQAKLTKAIDKQVGDPNASQQMSQQILDAVRATLQQAGVPLAPPVAPGAGVAPGSAAGSGLAAADEIVAAADAVAKVRANPELAAKVQAAVEPIVDEVLLSALAAADQAEWSADEAARAAASERAIQQGERLRSPTFLIAIALIGLPYIATLRVLFGETFSEQLQTVVVTASVTGVLSAVAGYYFGTTRQSAAKDAIVGEIAVRRAKT